MTCGGEAHARLDRAVWAAYGGDDLDLAEVDVEMILTRRLVLNREQLGAAARISG